MRKRARLTILLAWSSAIVLLAAAPAARGGRAPSPKPILNPPIDEAGRGKLQACSATSQAAERACSGDVQDEYWTEVGKCMNIASNGSRQQCMNDAKKAMDEALALCEDQFAAREEICDQLGQDPYDPAIDKNDFLTRDEAAAHPHPFFPLVTGMTWNYAGGGETGEVTVTNEIKEILGVECFVVRDVVRVGGVIAEDTQDWLAMDKDGNVWYMGEHSETWEDGELVNLDGSWKAGVNGARPGIIMKAQPEVDVLYRQEFLLAEAEDMAEVTSITGSESVPGGSCSGDCVVTHEFTPIEPGSGASKYYASGVGLILEVDDETGERTQLQAPGPGASLRGRGGSLTGSLPRVSLLSDLRVTGPVGSTGTESPIQFDLGREAEVNVDIYDPAGRRVRSIFTGKRDAGRHAFTWEGSDESGHRVASGIYFVRVRAGAESATGRIAVLAR